MTAQINLGLVWATGGGVTAVSGAKYVEGWLSEKPTFQNFNYMVQGIDQNVLHLAEEGTFDWQADITYAAGAKVKSAGVTYYALSAQAGNAPPNNTYWSLAPVIGLYNAGRRKARKGLSIDSTFQHDTITSYTGQDVTVTSKYPLLAFESLDVVAGDWGLGVLENAICTFKLGDSNNPDARSLDYGENAYRLFHEGHLPDVTEVVNAVEEAAIDSALYARSGGVWVPVTSTVIAEFAPTPLLGAGAGWYNTTDGTLYLDIDDGDTSQWVIACPTLIPNFLADDVDITPIAGMSATNVQDALEELYALI